jgi:hypothetical protein
MGWGWQRGRREEREGYSEVGREEDPVDVGEVGQVVPALGVVDGFVDCDGEHVEEDQQPEGLLADSKSRRKG